MLGGLIRSLLGAAGTTSGPDGAAPTRTDSAHRIHDQVEEQNHSLANVAGEMADFSATMAEVAASSNEVSEAATAAMAEVDRGVEAGADAREVIETVGGTSDELIETVDQLDEQMDEIGKVVDVNDEQAVSELVDRL